ncbi:MAG: PHP domain-containing protein [Thermodesulfobacteriota bacterium]|nr:PHP domain-containing protein [Thermodesulfobacteriota bacterium]
MSFDLHIHSTYSDGTMTPAEILQLARKYGLRTIALTDHDTTEGIAEALVQGKKQNIEVLTGIELSASFDSHPVHILGYGIDHTDPLLFENLKDIQKARKDRNDKIVARLQSFGLDISLDELDIISKSGQTGRPHIARLLVKKGFVSSTDQAFDRYLGKKGSAYTPRKSLPADQAIKMINMAKGIAVLAHPIIINVPFQSLVRMILKLRTAGLAGIEVFYPSHPPPFRLKLEKLCTEYGLLASGGSDFHGLLHPWSRLGCMIQGQSASDEIVEKLKAHLPAGRKHPSPQPSPQGEGGSPK